MPWEKLHPPWKKVSTPWTLSSTASISGGAAERCNGVLRKKYHVVRKKNHVVRKLFYVASIFHTPRSPRHHDAAPMTTERPTLHRCAQVLKTWQSWEQSWEGCGRQAMGISAEGAFCIHKTIPKFAGYMGLQTGRPLTTWHRNYDKSQRRSRHSSWQQCRLPWPNSWNCP